MKKEYKRPKITVIELQDEVALMAGSNENVGKGSGYNPDENPSPSPSGYNWALLPVIALSLFSCSSESENPSYDGDGTDLVQMTFRAVQEQSAATSAKPTRAQFTPNGNDRMVTWQADDKVSVMYATGGNSFSQQFSLYSGVGTTVGTFVGEAHQGAEAFTMLSPYQGQTAFTHTQGRVEEVSRIVLPTVQTATAGTFDPHAAVMMGKSPNDWTDNTTPVQLNFRNVCSFIELTPTFDCSAIIVSTRVKDEYLAGAITVVNGDIPTVDVNAGVFYGTLANKVSLTGTITAGNTYYIAVIPGTLNNGIRVTCVGSDGRMATRRTANAVTLVRSQYHNLSSFLDDPSAVALDGIDLGTGDGVLWASCNVGATAPHEYGDKYAWGDVMPLYSYDATNAHLNAGGSYYKADATWGNYKWGDGVNVQTPTSIDFTKYDALSASLQSADDAATQTLGSSWAIPTAVQIGNLIEKCDWSYVSNYNGTGVAGYTVTNRTDNTKQLFFPMPDGTTTCWWTNQLDESDNKRAKQLALTSSNHRIAADYRIANSFIRPVRSAN